MESMHSYAVNPWMIIPFALLLGAIAMMPLIAHKWWEHHYPKVALLLAAITLTYYLGVLKEFWQPVHILHEYFSFISLIAALFIVSGGIHIGVKGESTPLVNTAYLALGALVSNLIGTTGASMIFIRPFLRANKYRLTHYHVVFFIFIVSNVGGCLTPVGDPPLYLGYLQGIPFFWTTQNLFLPWTVAVGFLLAAFYFVDQRNFMRAPQVVREQETSHEKWSLDGRGNIIWLLVIFGALFVSKPLFLREGLMLFAGVMSYLFTKREVHEMNKFSWSPIKEVVILFIGIFITMMPALDWLEANSKHLGISSPASFYWSTGILSSILDNAPTYLNFLTASMGLFVDDAVLQEVQRLIANGGQLAVTGLAAENTREVLNTYKALKLYHPSALMGGSVPLEDLRICYLLGNHAAHIVAISVGAVFFGACTYIGNGPNFMVKSIAEHSHP
jgi:Na+/H+ antiporter NhaD/arsenite permease-like protein